MIKITDKVFQKHLIGDSLDFEVIVNKIEVLDIAGLEGKAERIPGAACEDKTPSDEWSSGGAEVFKVLRRCKKGGIADIITCSCTWYKLKDTFIKSNDFNVAGNFYLRVLKYTTPHDREIPKYLIQFQKI